MTRVLWLARAVPYPINDGATLVSAKSMEGLADAGGDVSCLGFAAPLGWTSQTPATPDPRVDWRVVPGEPRSQLAALASRLPLIAARHATAAFRAALATTLAEPWDAIVIDHYAMAWALPAVARARNAAGGRPVVAHLAHNFETEVSQAILADFRGDPLRRGLLYLNGRKIAAMERRIVAGCDLIIALTEEDAGSFRALAPGTQTLLCPPGYDGLPAEARSVGAAGRRICMLGSLRWIAKQMNLEAFLEVADPMLAEAGVHLDIIGDAPSEFVARLAPRLRATVFRGFVESVPEAIKDYRMGLVIEETGGGFKLKTLDYIFGRLPVAALEGSFRGVPAAVAETFVMADNAADLTARIIGVVDDVADLDRRQQLAAEAATGLFSWPQNGRRMLDAFARLGAS